MVLHDLKSVARCAHHRRTATNNMFIPSQNGEIQSARLEVNAQIWCQGFLLSGYSCLAAQVMWRARVKMVHSHVDYPSFSQNGNCLCSTLVKEAIISFVAQYFCNPLSRIFGL
jgi:hypothetical protein